MKTSHVVCSSELNRRYVDSNHDLADYICRLEAVVDVTGRLRHVLSKMTSRMHQSLLRNCPPRTDLGNYVFLRLDVFSSSTFVDRRIFSMDLDFERCYVTARQATARTKECKGDHLSRSHCLTTQRDDFVGSSRLM